MKQITTMCRILQDNIPFSAQEDEFNSSYSTTNGLGGQEFWAY